MLSCHPDKTKLAHSSFCTSTQSSTYARPWARVVRECRVSLRCVYSVFSMYGCTLQPATGPHSLKLAASGSLRFKRCLAQAPILDVSAREAWSLLQGGAVSGVVQKPGRTIKFVLQNAGSVNSFPPRSSPKNHEAAHLCPHVAELEIVNNHIIVATSAAFLPKSAGQCGAGRAAQAEACKMLGCKAKLN